MQRRTILNCSYRDPENQQKLKATVIIRGGGFKVKLCQHPRVT